MKTRLPLVFLLSVSLTACAIHKPCSEGGDISWTPRIQGDKKCQQKTQPDGKVVNDGYFRQYYSTTKGLALEGQFVLGQKQGIWQFYGEDQRLKTVKFFEKGVEKNPPPKVQKEIDLIIEQKTGMK